MKMLKCLFISFIEPKHYVHAQNTIYNIYTCRKRLHTHIGSRNNYDIYAMQIEGGLVAENNILTVPLPYHDDRGSHISRTKIYLRSVCFLTVFLTIGGVTVFTITIYRRGAC